MFVALVAMNFSHKNLCGHFGLLTFCCNTFCLHRDTGKQNKLRRSAASSTVTNSFFRGLLEQGRCFATPFTMSPKGCKASQCGNLLAAEYGYLVSGFQPITLANQNDLARLLYPVPTQLQQCSFHVSTRRERCCPSGGYRSSSSERCNRACPSG